MTISQIINALQITLLIVLTYFQLKTNELLLASYENNILLKNELLKHEKMAQDVLLKVDIIPAKLDVITYNTSNDLTWLIVAGVVSLIFLILIKRNDELLIKIAKSTKKDTADLISTQESIKQGMEDILEVIIPRVTSESSLSSHESIRSVGDILSEVIPRVTAETSFITDTITVVDEVVKVVIS